MKRSYITATAKDADIQVTESDLDNLSDEYELEYISLNEYDPSYMSGAELNITDKEFKTKAYKLPKKMSVTTDWIVSKIVSMQNTEKAYVNLSKVFKAIASKYEKAMNIYPTTYGIGVNTLYADTDEEFKAILSLLEDNQVKYRLEWSDAMWVKRIIISKTDDNLKRVGSIA